MASEKGNTSFELINTSFVSVSDKISKLSFIKGDHRGALSDELAHYVSIINIVGICTVVSFFGILANIINMVVLKRQGFHETVNITLFATAISDLISLVTTLWVAVCYNPLLLSANLPFIPSEVQMLTGEMPHVMAMNATSWLTAYVTFERCLCIAFPLKVKNILTTGRTKVIIVFIFFMVVAFQMPTYLKNRLEWKFDPETNQSLVGLEVTEEFILMNSVAVYVTNVFGPFLSFVIVVVCSTVLVVNLSQKSKWRRQLPVASISKEDTSANRDRRVMKMILAIAMFFIASYTPAIFVFIWYAKDLEFSPAGILANNYFVSVSFAFVFETVNASVNIFIYYNMSSKYKAIFLSIFLGKSVIN